MASLEALLDRGGLDEEDGPSSVISGALHTCHAGGGEIKQPIRLDFGYVVVVEER